MQPRSLQQFVDGSGIHLLDDGASRGKKNYGKAMKELQKKLDKRGANDSVGEEVQKFSFVKLLANLATFSQILKF